MDPNSTVASPGGDISSYLFCCRQVSNPQTFAHELCYSAIYWLSHCSRVQQHLQSHCCSDSHRLWPGFGPSFILYLQ
jgi:hypothetical protein